MTDNPPPGPGRVVAGRYLLQQRLGRGGMSTVWRARDQVLDRDVAVKIVAEMEDAEVTAERFRREARATAALNHPNIVTVFDAGVDDGRAFLVMELLPGHTLADEVRARGALPVEEVREIAVQVAGALSAAHAAGLVHRDIKPGNIARTAGGAAKVLDFGITHIIDEGAAHASHPLTATGAVIGTAAFLAPEQARGERVDGRADLYSLGCVLYALLTGQPPFRGATAVTTMMMHATEPAPRVLGARPDLPEGFAVVIQAMLQKDPNDRPQSADAVARAIRAQTPEEAAAYLPVPGANDDTTVMPARAATPADPADAEEPFQMEEAEGRRTRLLIGMVAVALLVAAGFAWWLLSQNASLSADPAPTAAVPGSPSPTPTLPSPEPTVVDTSSLESPSALPVDGATLTASPEPEPPATTQAPPPPATTAAPPPPPTTTQAPPSPPATTQAPPPPPETTRPPRRTQPPVNAGSAAREAQAAADRLSDAVREAVTGGELDKDFRKRIDSALRDLARATRSRDDQRASDALSEVDQALSDSGQKDRFNALFEELKNSVDTWKSAL